MRHNGNWYSGIFLPPMAFADYNFPVDADALDGGAPIEIPIDGVLDLHTFKPKEIGDLVPAYIDACREKGVLEVRIIHGKGVGNLLRTVHAILSRHPAVVRFSLASAAYGGSGATVAVLRPMGGGACLEKPS